MSGWGIGSVEFIDDDGDETTEAADDTVLTFDGDPTFDWTPVQDAAPEDPPPPPPPNDARKPDPAPVAVGANLLSNSSFESDRNWGVGAGWEVPFEWALAFHGTRVARIDAMGMVAEMVSRSFAVDPTLPYWASVWGWMQTWGSGSGRVLLREYDSEGLMLAESVVGEQESASTGWVRLSRQFVGRLQRSDQKAWDVRTTSAALVIQATGIFDWRVDGAQVAVGDLPGAYVPAPNEDVLGENIVLGTIPPEAFHPTIAPILIADELPVNIAAGQVVLVNGTLYRSTGYGWTAAVPASDVTGPIQGEQIASGAVDVDKFAPDVEPIRVAPTLPALPDARYPQGATIFLTSDNKLYRSTGTAWTASVPTDDLLGEIGPTQLEDGAVTLAKHADGLRPIQNVATLPTLPSATYPAGAVVFLTSDSKLYRSTGTAWTAAVPAVDLTGQVTTAQIADNAIKAAKIEDAALTLGKFGQDLRPVQLYTGALPALPNAVYPSGAVISSLTDNKVYRSTGSGWTSAVPAGDLTGAIVTAQIGDDAVTSDKLGEALANHLRRPNQANAIQNPGFESAGLWFTGWGATFVTDAANSRSGNRHLRMAPAGGVWAGTVQCSEDGTTFWLEVNEGDVVVYGAYAKRTSGDAFVRAYLSAADKDKLNATWVYGANVTTSAWTQTGGVYTVPAGKKYVSMVLESTGGSVATTSLWDDAYLMVQVTNAQIADSAVTGTKLANLAITTSKFADGIRPVGIVGSLPALPDTTYPVGAVVTLTTDGKLYRNVAGTWTAAVPTVDLTGTIATGQIADDAVTNAKIGPSAVDVLELANSAVRMDKLVPTVSNWLQRPDQENSLINPSFEATGYWTLPAGITYVTDAAGARSGNRYLQIVQQGVGVLNGTAQCNDAAAIRYVEVAEGDVIHFQAWAKRLSGNGDVWAGVGLYDKDMANPTWYLGSAVTSATWTLTSGQVTVPAGKKYLYFLMEAKNGTVITTAHFDDAAVYRRVTTSQINVGAVTAATIAAGAVTAEKLTVGALGDSAILNGSFEEALLADATRPAAWTTVVSSATAVLDTAQVKGGLRSLKMTLTSGASSASAFTWPAIPVAEGERWHLLIWAKGSSVATGTPILLRGRWYDAAGVVMSTSAAATAAPTTDWVKLEGLITVPAGAFAMSVEIYHHGPYMTGSPTYPHTVWFDNAEARRAVVSAVIDDGAITTPKLYAEAVTAAKVAAGAITTEKLTVGTISDNAVLNGSFEDASLADATKPADWTTDLLIAGSWALVNGTADVLTGGRSLSTTLTGVTGDVRAITHFDKRIQVAANEQWYVSVSHKASLATANGFYLRIHYYDHTGAWSSYVDLFASASFPNVWTRREGVVTIPGSARSMRIMLIHIGSGMVTFPHTVYWDDVVARKVVTSAVIADGAITTPKLVAGSVTANKMFVGTGVGSALNADPTTSDASAWEDASGSNWQIATVTDGKVGNSVLRSTGAAGGAGVQSLVSQRIPIDPSKTYRLHVWARRKTGDRYLYMGLRVTDQAGTVVTAGATGWPLISGNHYWTAGQSVAMLPADSVWREYVFTFGAGATPKLATGATHVQLLALLNWTGGTTDGIIEVQDYRLEEAIPGSLIVDGAIVAGKIAAGSIVASDIAAGAITSEKLTIASASDSAILNGGFEDLQRLDATKPAMWETSGLTWATETTEVLTGARSLKTTLANSGQSGWVAVAAAGYIPVAAGEQWYASLWAKAGQAAAGGLYLRMFLYTSSGAAASPSYIDIAVSAPFYVTWTKYEGSITIPAGAAYLRPAFYHHGPQLGAVTYPHLAYWDDFVARKVVVSAVIADGAITTPKMIANTIEGDRIKAGTLNADRIVADSIGAGQIAAGAVTTTELLAGAVTASKLLVTDFQNLMQDGGFESGDGEWTWDGAWSIATGNARNGTYHGQYSGTHAGTPWLSPSAPVEWKPGVDQGYVEVWYKTTADFVGTVRLGVYRYSGRGTGPIGQAITEVTGTATTTWTKLSANVPAPATGTFLMPYISVGGTNSVGTAYVDDLFFAKKATGSLIVDGTISANHVAAGSITASRMVLADGSNMFTDGSLQDPTLFAAPAIHLPTGGTDSYGGSVSRGVWRLPTASTNYVATILVPVRELDELRIVAQMRSETGTTTANYWLYSDAAKSVLIQGRTLIGSRTDIASMGTYSVNLTVPYNTRFLMFEIQTSAGTHATGNIVAGLGVFRRANASLIVDGAVIADKIGAGAVIAGKVAANAITTENLTVGSVSDNAVLNGGFEDVKAADATKPASWTEHVGNTTANADWGLTTTSPGAGLRSLTMTLPANTDVMAVGSMSPADGGGVSQIPVREGEQWYVSALFKGSTASTGAGSTIYIHWHDKNGFYLSSAVLSWPWSTTWTRREIVATVPLSTGVAFMSVALWAVGGSSGGATFPFTGYADDVVAKRLDVSAVIADGAITAKKLFIAAGAGAALNRDPMTADVTAWSAYGTANWEIAGVTDGKVGGSVIRSVAVAGPAWVYETTRVPIDPTKSYRLHAWIRRKSGDRGIYLVARFTDQSGNVVVNGGSGWGLGTMCYWGLINALTPTVPADSVWREYNQRFGAQGYAIPTNAAYVQIGAILNYDSSGTTNGVVEMQDARVEEVIPGQLIVDGTITAAKIAAGAITTEKLTVGSMGESAVRNGSFEDVTEADATKPVGWTTGEGGTLATWTIENTAANVHSGVRSLKTVVPSNTEYRRLDSSLIPVSGGEKWYISVWSKASTASTGAQYVRMRFTDAAGGNASTQDIWSGGPFTTAWTKVEGQVTVPDIATQMQIFLYHFSPGMSGGTYPHSVWWDDVVAQRVTVSAQIQDGAITAAKVLAGAITTEKLTIGSASDSAVLNGGFEDLQAADATKPANWVDNGSNSGGTWVVSTAQVRTGLRSLAMGLTGNTSVALPVTAPAARIPVAAGEQWYFSAHVLGSSASASGGYLEALFWDKDGGGYQAVLVFAFAWTTSWTKREGVITVPAGKTQMAIQPYSHGPSMGATTYPHTGYWDDIVARKVVVSAVIADGAITANKVLAGAITTEKLTVLAMGENAAPNGGFEDVQFADASKPAHWQRDANNSTANGTWYVQSVTPEPQQGARYLVLGIPTATDISAVSTVSLAIPCSAGEQWYVSAWMRGAGPVVGGTAAKLMVHFYSASAWIRTDVAYEGAWPGGVWLKREGIVTVPAGANRMGFGIWNKGPDGTGQGSAFWGMVDDFQAKKVVTNFVVGEGAITTDKMTINTILGDRIQSNTLDAGKITAYTITTGQIQAAGVSGDRIIAGSITAERLTVGSMGDNAILNGGFEDVSAANTGLPAAMIHAEATGSPLPTYGMETTAAHVRTGTRSWRSVLANATGYQVLRHKVNVSADEVWYVSVWAKGSTQTSGGMYLRCWWLDSSGAWIGSSHDIAATNFYATWTKYEGVVTIPAGYGITAMWVGFYHYGVGMPGATYPHTAWFDDLTARKAVVTAVISDGAVVADKIATNAVTALKIQAGAVTASKLTVRNFQNLVWNPGFERGHENWYTGAGVSVDTAVARNGTRSSKWVYTGGSGYQSALWAGPGGVTPYLDAIPVRAGEKYYAEMFVRTSSGTVTNGGAYLCFDFYVANAGGTSDWGRRVNSPYRTTFTGGWDLVDHTVTVPADLPGVAYMYVVPIIDVNQAGSVTFNIDDVYCMKQGPATVIEDGAVITSKMYANSIHGDRITAGTLHASKLVVSDWNNYVPDGGFEEGGAGWTISSNWSVTTDSPRSGAKSLKWSPGTGDAWCYPPNYLEVKSGDIWYLEAWVKSSLASGMGNIAIALACYSGKGTGYLGWVYIVAGPSTSWQKVVLDSPTLFSGTKYIFPLVAPSGSNGTGTWYVDDMVLSRKESGSLIVDGTLEASKLVVGVTGAVNLATNGGFRNGMAGWTAWTNGSFTTNVYQNGTWVLADGDVDGWNPSTGPLGSAVYLWTNVNSGRGSVFQAIAAAPGEYFSLSGLLGQHRCTGAYLYIVFKNAAGAALGSNVLSALATASGGNERASWSYCTIDGALAPAGTRWIEYGAYADAPFTSGSDLYLFMDQFMLTRTKKAVPYVPHESDSVRAASSQVIIDNSGLTVTNGMLAVTAASGGVVINNTGIAITNGKLTFKNSGGADVLGASGISANAVGTAAIADNAVLTAKIGDDQVVNSKIGPLAVQATEINDNAVITRTVLAGAITTDKLTIGSVSDNAVLNGSFEDDQPGRPAAQWARDPNSTAGGGQYANGDAWWTRSGKRGMLLTIGGNTDISGIVQDVSIPVTGYISALVPEEKWYLSYWQWGNPGSAGGARFWAFWYNAAGTYLSGDYLDTPAYSGWTQVERIVSPPAGAAQLRISIWYVGADAGVGVATLGIDDVVARRMVTSTVISQNGIKSTHIAAGELLADRIGSGEIIITTSADGLRPDGLVFRDESQLDIARWDENGLYLYATPTVQGELPTSYLRSTGGSIAMVRDGVTVGSITPDGLDASSITSGIAPGAVNLVPNSGFELNTFGVVAGGPVTHDVAANWSANQVATDNLLVDTNDLRYAAGGTTF
jgi:hypothetical protein